MESWKNALPWASILAIAGLLLTGMSAHRWAPDTALRLPDREEALCQALEDAEDLGYGVSDDASQQVTAGTRIYQTDYDLAKLVREEGDPAERRRRIEETPPLRLGLRFADAVDPRDEPGVLLLEYDGDLRLTGASFGWDGRLAAGVQPWATRAFANRLVAKLLGSPPPEPVETRRGGGVEFVYSPDGGGPGAYVYLGGDASWIAHRQPTPYAMLTDVSQLTRRTSSRIQILGLLFMAVLTVGVLLWRLTRHRAGFSHAPLLAALLVLGWLPMLPYRPQGTSLILFVLAYLVVLAGVLLCWSAAEAEMRETQPGSVEHWDRLVQRQFVAGTGRALILGVLFGCGLGGLLAASGRIAEAAGGGYGSFLILLPEYWIVPTPLAWGLAFTALTAFLVAFGGRLGGRVGATLGAVASTLAWAIPVPVAPFALSMPFALAAALTAGWLAWHQGLLTATAASVTALSLPTAWVAWSIFPERGETAVVASLPLLALALGAYLWRTAPEADAGSVVPTYVSQLESETRLKAEVEVLRKFQLSLLPQRALAAAAGAETAWRMTPADTVGGDLLDLVVDDAGRLWIALADAAGHGLSCSALTAFTKAAIAEHAVAERGPAEALYNVRRLFSRLHLSRSMVTLLLAVWDPARRRITVANAGHPPLLLATGGTFQEVGRPGRPLATGLKGEDEEMCVECPGDAVLVGYTDGVIEATSPAGESFGYERWPARLVELAEDSAAEILDGLLADVDGHLAGRPAHDDITALVVKIQPASS